MDAAISEVNLINAGRSSGSNYWLQILDEGGLLWGEENDEFKRGEWIFGVGEGRTYVQVYFAKNKNNLPALVRYILPRDWNARFSKKGSVVSEMRLFGNVLETDTYL